MWSLADDFAEDDGSMPGYTREDIDAHVGIPGFCDALPEDWFREDQYGIYLPEYQEHNGTTGKVRALESKRKRESRASGSCPDSVRNLSGKKRTKTGLEERREEENREEKNTSCGGGKIALNWKTGEWENILDQDWSVWAKAYPAVDCKQEVLKALAWCIANPSKGKKSNYRKFLTGWLNRTQDSGGSRGTAQPITIAPQREKTAAERQQEQNEQARINAERARRDAIYAKLAPEDVERLKRLVVAKSGPFSATRFREADPASNSVLKAAIVAEYERELKGENQ
jgi:hypothetical protein